jgi:uncharacterized repeat protein (TIGR03847 family)
MNPSFEIDQPDHFTTGAVGPKGKRVFYLQARQDGIVASFKVEKQQVQVLADYLEGMLDNMRGGDEPVFAPPLELIEPVEVEWVIGELGIGYDEANDRIVLHAQELIADESDDETSAAAVARIHLQRRQIIAFIRKARELIAAGRPLCPFCSRPLDPEQGLCACYN